MTGIDTAASLCYDLGMETNTNNNPDTPASRALAADLADLAAWGIDPTPSDVALLAGRVEVIPFDACVVERGGPAARCWCPTHGGQQ